LPAAGPGVATEARQVFAVSPIDLLRDEVALLERLLATVLRCLRRLLIGGPEDVAGSLRPLLAVHAGRVMAADIGTGYGRDQLVIVLRHSGFLLLSPAEAVGD